MSPWATSSSASPRSASRDLQVTHAHRGGSAPAGVGPPRQHAPHLQQTQRGVKGETSMPSSGGQISGMADTIAKPGSVGWRGVGIPLTSARATTRLPGGRPDNLGRRLAGMLPPGEPRGRAMPGRRDATRLPACKIITGCRHAYQSAARSGAPGDTSGVVVPFHRGSANGGRRGLTAADGDREQDRHCAHLCWPRLASPGKRWCPRQKSNLRHTV